MANVRALHSVGESLRHYLTSTYPSSLSEEHSCSFEVLSSGQLSAFEEPTENSVAVTLYLYRVTISPELRNSFVAGRSPREIPPALPLELHWLMSVWANSAAAEQIVFAWALRQLARMPVLDATMLHEDPDLTGWAPGEVLHVVPEELPVEDMMRVWDALEPSYRLSASYVVRAVRLDMADTAAPPVVAMRFETQAGEAET